MRYEPRFDDPSRTADYGHFPRERIKSPKITGDDLADAIRSGSAPDGAPFRDWVPQVFEGWIYKPMDLSDCMKHLRAWLASSDDRYIGDVMDILSDIAHDLYGANNE